MSQSLSDLQQSVPSDVRELLLHQLASWQQGTRLPIETIVVKAKPEHRIVAAQSLIKQEIVLREQAGEAPRLDEYLSRFPEVAECLPKDLGSEFEMTMAIAIGSPSVDGAHDTHDQTLERTFAGAAVSPPSNSGFYRVPKDGFIGDSEPTKSGPQKREDSVNRMIGMYRLEKKLGQGGMGSVFKAVHTKLDKIVAIKVLSRQGLLDDTGVERFEREMRAVGRIDHPHVIRAMDAGEADGFHYLVMEYVEGIDVSQAVKKNGPFPVGQACEIIRQSALGLHEAHLLGLVHRDIKPSNLFLTRRGIVKILDLGLARLAEGPAQNLDLTLSGLCMGTPDYMAPEQWVSARDVDGRCDFYALGCTLFHLLIGRPPFGTKEHLSLGNKVLAHTSGVIPDIRLLCADFPEGLKPVLDKMLAKERLQRYANGEELAQALLPFCTPLPGAENASSSSVHAMPLVVPQKPRSNQLVRLLAMWGGGAAMLALAAFIIIKITDSNGRVTEIKVPAGDSINISYVDDNGTTTGAVVTKAEKSETTGIAKTGPGKADPVKTDQSKSDSSKAGAGTSAIAKSGAEPNSKTNGEKKVGSELSAV
ncbi:MAG: pknH 3, partial [Planctomycetaceae bacterium]|nr:pknH 3 [Planctomycetaceae bacterium]